MPSAPLSTSSQSRNKLRTFVFEAKTVEDAPEDDKENIGSQVSRHVPVASSPKSQDSHLEKSSPQLPKLPSQKKCPQTPTNRIPLADLIGNTEDAFNCNPKDTTPEDHIYWQHGPTPRSSIPPASANSTRRKKRARSSSPPSSSQNHKSARVDAQEALDLKTLHESLKTPQNDPVLDLWARYTDASLMKKDTNGNAIPAFAHLMTSSPQTQNATNMKDSGLRRSISCGIEWPASKAKRQKTNHKVAEGRVRDTLAASKKDIMATGKSKASRISLLMEKLQENSMKAPQIEVSGPSSSSPLPGRSGLPNLLEVSPVPLRKITPNENGKSIPDADENHPICDVPERQQDYLETTSSEFGDEDLGLEVLEAVEQSTCTQVGLPSAKTNDMNNAAANDEAAPQAPIDFGDRYGNSGPFRGPRLGAPRPASSSHVEANAGQLAQAVATASDSDNDEFGDEIDDSGALADLAAQFDSQETTHPPLVRSQVEHAVVEHSSGYKDHTRPDFTANDGEDDDDAYDDDDDLWNQIGDGSVLLEEGSGMASARQVRVIL
jgi:DNA replication ATP-dependent helicase Dna2